MLNQTNGLRLAGSEHKKLIQVKPL